MNFKRLILGFSALVMSGHVQAMETNFSKDKTIEDNNKSNIEDKIDDVAEEMSSELGVQYILEQQLEVRSIRVMGGERIPKGYTMQIMKQIEQSEVRLNNLSKKYVTLKKSNNEIKDLLNQIVKLRETFEITFWIPNGGPEKAIKDFLEKAKNKKSIMIAYYDLNELESEESVKSIDGKSRKIIQHTISVKEKRDIVNIVNNSTEKHPVIEHIFLVDSSNDTYKNIIEKQKSVSPEDFVGEMPSQLKPALKKIIFTVER